MALQYRPVQLWTLGTAVKRYATADSENSDATLIDHKQRTPLSFVGVNGLNLREHAYSYHKILQRELISIRRVKELQWRVVTLSGSAIVAAMTGISNLASRFLYEWWRGESD